MKNYPILSLLMIVTLSGYCQEEGELDKVRVFYLGGQSNMDGYGFVSELPDELNQTFEDVWIFHGNPVGDDQEGGGLGIWEPLKPGHGKDFASDGQSNQYSDRFGVELSLARRLRELYPNDRIAFIKYSRGGTSIDSIAARNFGSWEPDYQGTLGLNQYDYFLTTIDLAMNYSDIDGDGKDERLMPSGIFWMQGESDATVNEEVAQNYYKNLQRLMDLMRASLRVDDLPVIIGKISDSGNDEDGKVWDYGELIQYAQEKYAKTDARAVIVRSTKSYDYSDKWHYDSSGYIDLGNQFAKAYYELVTNTEH